MYNLFMKAKNLWIEISKHWLYSSNSLYGVSMHQEFTWLPRSSTWINTYHLLVGDFSLRLPRDCYLHPIYHFVFAAQLIQHLSIDVYLLSIPSLGGISLKAHNVAFRLTCHAKLANNGHAVLTIIYKATIHHCVVAG